MNIKKSAAAPLRRSASYAGLKWTLAQTTVEFTEVKENISVLLIEKYCSISPYFSRQRTTTEL